MATTTAASTASEDSNDATAVVASQLTCMRAAFAADRERHFG